MNMKNAMKTVIALGSGAAMLGATIGGALAADLGDYPAPFIMDGAFNGKLVVGEKANAADILGAIDIAASLQRLATVPMTVSGAGVSVSDGRTEKVDLGSPIAASGFLDTTYTNTDLSVLQDTSVDVNGTSRNVHDEIVLVQTANNLDVETGLTANSKDYGTTIGLTAARGALKYCYYFDENVNLANDVSSDTPLEINFLGQNLKITRIVDAQSLTAQAGREVFLTAGASQVIDGKKVTLERAGDTSAVVTVDGTPKSIRVGSNYNFGGLRVKVDSTFSSSDVKDSSATLIVGTDTDKTYSDGDAWIGQDKDNPDWVWEFTALNATTGQTLCIKNDFNVINYDDGVKKVGEYYNFPNNFVSVGVASLTVPDDKYMNFDVEFRTADLSQGGGSSTAKTFTLTAGEDDTIVFPTTANFTSALASDIKAKVAYLVKNGTAVSVYYKDRSNSNRVAFAGEIELADSDNVSMVVGNFNYGKTKGTDVQLVLSGNSSLNDNVYFGLVPTVPTSDAVWVQLGNSGADFDGTGTTSSTEQAEELRWGSTTDPTAGRNIGTKDEDERTAYGIWIGNPKSSGSADKYRFHVPNDQVQANAVIKSGKGAIGGSSGGTYDKVNPIPVGMGILDKDANLGGSTPYIVVGGPCANTVAFQLLAPATADACAAGFSDGEAKIKWFGDKNALLVAGYSAQDTVGASRVVANFGDYPTGFAAGKTEFAVVTTSLTDIKVK